MNLLSDDVTALFLLAVNLDHSIGYVPRTAKRHWATPLCRYIVCVAKPCIDGSWISSSPPLPPPPPSPVIKSTLWLGFLTEFGITSEDAVTVMDEADKYLQVDISLLLYTRVPWSSFSFPCSPGLDGSISPMLESQYVYIYWSCIVREPGTWWCLLQNKMILSCTFDRNYIP